MNILFISHLSTNISAGLNWSVPASVDHQAKYDNVLWVNKSEAEMPHWKAVKAYHNYKDFGVTFDVDKLPHPFSSPDVVVFEGFYFLDDVKVSRILIRKKIPYIIVVRGSLTKQALHNKSWLKKLVAHFLFFDSYVKKALSIQYLTENEAYNAPKRFRSHFFVLPNGFDTPSEHKRHYSDSGVRVLFIGRLDMYHKGIDMLLNAIISNKEAFRSSHFVFEIHGPKKYDYFKIMDIIEHNGVDDFVFLEDEISGQEKVHSLLGADAFIMTSRFEGHPMGLIEALAYGVPCIVTPGTNMSSEILEYNAGWVCSENSESIKDALMRVDSDRTLWQRKGKNARRLSLNYKWDSICWRFHAILSDLLPV